MSGWARTALWVMVILGIPCALALWIDWCLGPLRRWVHRRSSRPGESAGAGPWSPRAPAGQEQARTGRGEGG